MDKYIFFVFDYRSLLYALAIIEQLTKIESIEFVVSLEPLSMFIKSLSISNAKVILSKNDNICSRNVFKYPLHKRRLKNVYERTFSHKEGYAVYFFEMGFDLHLLYFIKRLCRKNSVFYLEYFSYPSTFELEKSLKINIKHLIYRYIYSLKVDTYLIRDNSTCVALSPAFLSNNKINIINNKIDLVKVLKKYAVKDSRFESAKVLFLVVDFVQAGIISQHTSDIFHEKLSSFLSRIFKREEIIVKPHPTFNMNISPVFQKHAIVDSKIPAEFLFYTGKIKIILGAGSTSQISATEMDEVIFILLYKLVGFSPIDVASMEKHFCSKEMKECNNLIVPKTWEELEEVLQRCVLNELP